MPGPAVVAIPGAVAAAKHLAFQAATYADVYAFSSAAAAALVTQWVWKRIPHWVKEDLSFRNLMGGNMSAREELSHLGSVLDKLQALAESAQVDADIPQIHAALLAYIQLSGQLKLLQQQEQQQQQTMERGKEHDKLASSTSLMTKRDCMYESAGVSLPLSELQSPALQQALNFATWAYYDTKDMVQEKLAEHEEEYEMMTYSQSTRPGNVGYFMAVSAQKRQVILAVRGTSSLEDILTDCCGKAVPMEDIQDDTIRIEVEASKPHEILVVPTIDNGDVVEVISGHERIYCDDHDDDGDNYIRCHEGILISARRMVNKVEPLIKDWILDAGYRLVICGHSLGAGAATLAAMVLRSRHAVLAEPGRIQVYAFAPPPVLDHDSALASATFCTSVVNNADIIPRSSLSSLAIFLESLRAVHCKLVEQDMNPTGPRTTTAFINHLTKGTNAKLLMTADELQETIQQAHEKTVIRRPQHLFVPGRVLLAYSRWTDEVIPKDEVDEEEKTDKSDGPTTDPVVRCVETDGASAVFRTLEVDGPRLFANHVTSSYFEVLGMDYQF